MNDLGVTCIAGSLIACGIAAELNLLRFLVKESRSGQAPRRAAREHARGSRPRRSGRQAAVGGVMLCLGASVVHAQTSAQLQGEADRGAQASAGQLSLGAAAVVPSEAPAVVIAADRPGFSDTASIVPALRLQLETGYTYTFRDDDDVETSRHTFPETVARFGLLEDRLELRFVSSGYAWSRSEDEGASSSIEGWSDVALGFKLKLTDQDGAVPRLALVGVSTVGGGSRETSTRRAEPTAKLIWAYDLDKLAGEAFKGWGVYGNLNVAYPTTDGDRFVQGAGSLCVTYAATSDVTVFAEYFVVGPVSKGGDEAHSIDFGAAYLLNSNVQLDGRVGFGLNDEADDVFVGIGVSVLF